MSDAVRFERRVVNGRVRVPVRLELELYEALSATCGIVGVAMNEALCQAAAEWVAARCTASREVAEAVRAIVEREAPGPLAGEGEG